ncbi:MAG: tRNA pseudouridine(13) synthase TruD [Phycisphaeraceae bacterium]|nr:tRNA pseudouridine(13) synthase TruD [Phycisphaeraceae bacterium]
MPFATADLPGIGGRIKERPEDFFVDEQPLYQPAGEGEHVYLFIEKRGLSTLRAARIVARHFGVHVSAVGFAGLKDKRAVTRQVFSVHVPGKKPEDFPMLQHEHMGVLWVDLHHNKLRRGHLLGNRFSIKIRGVDMSKAPAALRVLSRLERSGVPNVIGEQRFGYLRRNHLVGRGLILGDHGAVVRAVLDPDESAADTQAPARRAAAAGEYAEAMELFGKEMRTERRVVGELMRGASPSRAVHAIERSEAEFFLTAFQSAVFNRVLAERMAAGTIGKLMEGDVAFKHDNRACFDVRAEDLGPELTARLDRIEVSPSGPMWGADMKRAAAGVGVTEEAALAESGVGVEALRAFEVRRRGRLTGERKPLRVPVMDAMVEGGVDEHGHYVRVAFDLPRGAFATSVIREITKVEGRGEAESGEPEE